MRRRVGLWMLVAVLAGCGEALVVGGGDASYDAFDATEPTDAGDGRPADAAPADAAPADDLGPPVDARPPADAATTDAAIPDAALILDAAGPDAEPDGAAPDARLDAAPGDVGVDASDTGRVDDQFVVVPADAAADAAVDAAADAAPDAAPDLGPAGCVPGEVRGCGPALGRCRPGLERCGEDGRFSDCAGGQGPTPETCDGVDEDCDGRVDEGLTRVCGEAVGACRTGRSQCVDGAWTPCDGAADARDEVCDGVDDDCDGAIDEGLTRPCGPAVGRCVAGIESCVVGAWGLCEGGVGPAPEACNGVDDDCDGETDEQLARACAPQGGCDGGYRACEDGAFGDCREAAPALPEACDGVDNDCDGQVDEGLVLSCGSDVGACLPGLRACVDGAYEVACVGEVGPAPETCDGEDEDCDGQVDEDAPARPCGFPAIGRCAPGRQVCVDGAYAEACVGGVGPLDEDCNGVDDDCDGDIDEGIPPRPCGSDVGQCRPGIETCDIGGWGRCEGRVRPVRELCNRLDDDCDGRVDEGIGLDDDEDGLEDCVELDVGLDPSDPTDALGDFDHDGISNADEVAMGTSLWSTLYLHPVAPRAGAPADQVEVSLRLYQPAADLQPEIAEIYLFDNGEVADLVEVQRGPSALAANKDVIGQTLNAFETRIVIVAPNLDRMPSGELARLILRRRAPQPISIRVLRAPTRFAPAEADAALNAGTAAHRVPLEIP